jgi:hypothetical protein
MIKDLHFNRNFVKLDILTHVNQTKPSHQSIIIDTDTIHYISKIDDENIYIVGLSNKEFIIEESAFNELCKIL